MSERALVQLLGAIYIARAVEASDLYEPMTRKERHVVVPHVADLVNYSWIELPPARQSLFLDNAEPRDAEVLQDILLGRWLRMRRRAAP